MTSMPSAAQSRGAATKSEEADDSAIANSSVDEPPDVAGCAVDGAVKHSVTKSLTEESALVGLQAKKSSFQITRVVAKSDGDSLDDLDEVTNTEEMSSFVDASHNQWSSVETIHSPCEFSPRSPGITNPHPVSTVVSNHLYRLPDEHSPTNADDARSRFRIVKVECRTPFTRGRWKCNDFNDPPSTNQANGPADSQVTVQNVHSPAPPPIYFVDPGAAFTPAFVYSDGHPVLERNPLVSLADGNIYDTIVSTQPPDIVYPALPIETADIEKNTATSCTGIVPNEVLARRQSDLSLLSSAANGLVLPECSTESAPGTFAIDNKIEQAMDLVKSHLMFAVHEEVEVLKEQIKELMLKNEQLEYENKILRSTASPETIAKLDADLVAPATISQILGHLPVGNLS